MEVVTTTDRIVKTLSYTEVQILQALAGKLESDSAKVVMSEVTENRSKAVQLLAKLSAAGILESRSLGMKGTFIKVINREAFDTIVREVSV